MRGLEANQQMNMIFNATDFQWLAPELVSDSAEILVKPCDPLIFNPRLAVLG